MTQPSETAIRAACAEAGVEYGYVCETLNTSVKGAILALARRIEAEQAAVPVATVHVTHGGYSMRLAIHSAYVLPEGNDIPLYAHPPTDRKKLWCETCGKDVPEVLCPTCAKWWHDNAPSADRERIAELEAASFELGGWMSAAMDDPAVCDAMKTDINRWFIARQALKGTGDVG